MVCDEIKDGHCQENYSGPVEPDPLSKMQHGVLASLVNKQSLNFNFYVLPDERHLELTRSGVEFVNDLSAYAYKMSMEHLTKGREPPFIVPASDRTVTLDHNQADYKEVVADLDVVISEFRDDQHLDNELGPKKDALLKILEGGRKLLDETSVVVSECIDWLIKKVNHRDTEAQRCCSRW